MYAPPKHPEQETMLRVSPGGHRRFGKKPKHTELFTEGETFGAVADVGGDFEDIFG